MIALLCVGPWTDDWNGDAALVPGGVGPSVVDLRFCGLDRLLGALAFNGKHKPEARFGFLAVRLAAPFSWPSWAELVFVRQRTLPTHRRDSAPLRPALLSATGETPGMVDESAAPALAPTRQGERDEPRLSEPTAARAGAPAPPPALDRHPLCVGKDRVAWRSRTLPDMPDIPTLVASLDTRLDELVTEISTLEAARAALTRTLAAPPTTAAHNGATPKRPRRPAPQTNTAAPTPGPPATDPRPELATTATGSKSDASTARRRASATTSPRKRVSSLSAEQLEQLLAGGRSGLSAGAIAEQVGVGYSPVLARLRELEASGRVRRTGSRRSTLWRLVTDEDRIAQRRAELERLVGARRDDRTQRRGRARAS
jgi:hypothetical protein